MKNTRGRNRIEIVSSEEPYRTFLESLRQRRQSEKTVQSAGLAFMHLDAFLKTDGRALTDVTADDLDRFRRSLADGGHALMSADLILRQTRRFFRWLAETGRIFLDPATLWSLPKPDRPLMPVPSEQQVAALLSQPDLTRPKGIRDRALIETVYSTGVRLEELALMTILDPDFNRGLLRVTGKGQKERMLPLGKQAVRWLLQYIRDARPKLAGGKLDEEQLWIGADGRPLSAAGIRMMMKSYARAANLPSISPHSLRRACATHMLQHGAHPVQIQLLLGHADLSTLSQYLRLTIRDIRAMHAAGKPGR
jgi:integrase/recombinase XerD